MLRQALEDDLEKLAQARTGIDNLVAGQVEKLAQGRDILTRALEADLKKLTDARADIDQLVAAQVQKIERRDGGSGGGGGGNSGGGSNAPRPAASNEPTNYDGEEPF